MNHNSSFKDDQIRAIFAIAPALGGAFSKDGFAQIEIPVHIVVGTADSIAPVATNAGYFAGAIEKAQLTMLENVTHYTFLAECTELGKIELPLYCANAKVERSVIHQQVARLALQFFIRTL